MKYIFLILKHHFLLRLISVEEVSVLGHENCRGTWNAAIGHIQLYLLLIQVPQQTQVCQEFVPFIPGQLRFTENIKHPDNVSLQYTSLAFDLTEPLAFSFYLVCALVCQ